MNKFAKSSNIDEEGKYVSLPDWQREKLFASGKNVKIVGGLPEN